MSKEKKEFNLTEVILTGVIRSLLAYYVVAPLLVFLIVVIGFAIGLLIYHPWNP